MSAILLYDVKYPHNLGNVIRSAACYGVDSVYVYGRRWEDGLSSETMSKKGFRLPREERMRDYAKVNWKVLESDKPFDEIMWLRAHERMEIPESRRPSGAPLTPVAVEITPSSELLPQFEHPQDALYVFGPEDGTLGKVPLMHCHRFVKIPTYHCLNLANAVGTVLYDREMKVVLAGGDPKATGGEALDWLLTGRYASS